MERTELCEVVFDRPCIIIFVWYLSPRWTTDNFFPQNGYCAVVKRSNSRCQLPLWFASLSIRIQCRRYSTGSTCTSSGLCLLGTFLCPIMLQWFLKDILSTYYSQYCAYNNIPPGYTRLSKSSPPLFFVVLFVIEHFNWHFVEQEREAEIRWEIWLFDATIKIEHNDANWSR